MRQWKKDMKVQEGRTKRRGPKALVQALLGKRRKEKQRKEKPERFKFHEPAEISIDKSIALYLNEFEFNVTDGNGKLIPSALILKIPETRTVLCHDNVTSPQVYLQDAIHDVIRCYGLTARVIMEASLFSLRPDLVVVVFLAEVKNPLSEESKDDFNAETAAGQALDYGLMLKQSGIDQPFVLVSTYNRSVIARFSNEDEAYHRHLLEASKKLASRSIVEVRHDKDDTGNVQTKPPKSSVG